jgi:ArsR family transcriptional regulator
MKREIDPDVRLLQAAADPTRLAILRQLSARGPVCACDFTGPSSVSQPTISHHLRVLREAGWVDGERRGTWIWYAIRPEAAARFGSLAGEMSPGPALPASSLGSAGLPHAGLGAPDASSDASPTVARATGPIA